MANSRRRERELARRRYERRRLREQQLRARRRRRNTIIGASVGTAAVIALIVVLALHFASGDDTGKADAAATPTASTEPTSTPPAAGPKKCAPIKPNPPADGQPTVPPVKGKVPTKLVTKDIKDGQGPAAKNGDALSVTYIGVSCSTGKVFDASYKNGNQPFEVKPLGEAQVIAGWNQGLVGMKEGGVRELIIPSDLAYGASGRPPAIPPNDTLIFLVTAESVKA